MSSSRLVSIVAVFSLLWVAVPAQANNHGKRLPDGIVSVDTYSRAKLKTMIENGYRPEIPWEEAYGHFVDVNAYVPGLTVQEVYNFVQDTTNLSQWTMSVTNVQPFGTLNGRTRYSFQETLPPGGELYITEEKHPEVYTVDWWVGHSADDIWMHYYIRILDAQTYMGKPGIIIDWVNFGHANFERDPDLQQGFLMMKIAHGIERENLIKILQWRHAGNTGEPDLATQAMLGLVNTRLYGPGDIWMMLATQVTPTVTWEELYGGFISSHFYLVDEPVEQVWAYLKDPRNLNRWSVSTRTVVDLPGSGFIAVEALDPLGVLLASQTISEPTKTLDLRIANSRYLLQLGATMWMTSSFRVIDGPDSVGKPGSVVVWTTYHHVAYDRLRELRELWTYLPVRNAFAANNFALLMAQQQ